MFLNSGTLQCKRQYGNPGTVGNTLPGLLELHRTDLWEM